MNQITLNYLISKKFKTKIESRYLFECSIIKRCSNLGANITSISNAYNIWQRMEKFNEIFKNDLPTFKILG